MSLWNNDDELFTIAKEELFTALVGDVMDTMGLVHQFLPQPVKPLRDDMRVIGRAMPVLECDAYSYSDTNRKSDVMEKPFGLMFDALDDLKQNEVYVCTGASLNYALWGGLMTVRAMHLKAAGAVLNGYTRDTPEVTRMNFPTFCRGTYAQDQGMRGKVVDFRSPVEIEGIRVEPGDIVFGDLDGIIVVPRVAEEEAFSLAIEKGRKEKEVLNALQNGMSCRAAFKEYGIM